MNLLRMLIYLKLSGMTLNVIYTKDKLEGGSFANRCPVKFICVSFLAHLNYLVCKYCFVTF